MARSWLVDSRGLAKKVKNAGLPAAYQLKDCGANRECPNCHYHIDNTDVSQDWPGLPAGVKFCPSDAELFDHLSAKCGVGDSEPHLFIDEFIPTLEGDEGICYTHPENLPGAKKDGSSVYFFYKIYNAYSSGKRKRRRIHDQERIVDTQVRWHKTGKTKPVLLHKLVKGYKKIMVLYATSKKGSKPEKCKWVMHQYHLGTDEDEEEGQYVVSRIFYQQSETDHNETSSMIENSEIGTIPKTPKTNTPNPPRSHKTSSGDICSDDCFIKSSVQKAMKFLPEDEAEYSTSLVGQSKPVEFEGLDSLFRNDSNMYLGDRILKNASSNLVHGKRIDLNVNDSKGIPDLENIEPDTPPDFSLSDLQFSSQDSVFDWLNIDI